MQEYLQQTKDHKFCAMEMLCSLS